MSKESKNIQRIPMFVKAKSEDELSKKCYLNNLKNDKMFEYFSITKSGSNWVAWFHADISDYVPLGSDE